MNIKRGGIESNPLGISSKKDTNWQLVYHKKNFCKGVKLVSWPSSLFILSLRMGHTVYPLHYGAKVELK